MSMEQGGERLDETFEQTTDDSQDWYFDLPNGAWERQEAKNRQLRQNLLRQTGEPVDSPRDPITGRPAPQRKLFGIGRKKDEPQPAEGPRPRFEHRESDADPVSRFRALRDDPGAEDDAWSTEPATWTPPDEHAPLLRGRMADPVGSDHDESRAGEPKSRWEQMFGAGAVGGGGLDAMREWASRSPSSSEATAPAQEEEPSTADHAGEPVEAPSASIQPRPMGEPSADEPGPAADELAHGDTLDDADQADETSIELAIDEPSPPTPFVDVRTPLLPIEPEPAEADGLEAMRQWAHLARSEHDHRRQRILEEMPSGQNEASPGPGALVGAHITEPIAFPRPTQEVGTPSGLTDDADAVHSVPTDAPIVNEPPALDEGSRFDATNLESAGNADDLGDTAGSTSIPSAPVSPTPRRGFLGRLFGRGPKSEPPAESHAEKAVEGLVASTSGTGWLDPDGEAGWGSRSTSEWPQRAGSSGREDDDSEWSFVPEQTGSEAAADNSTEPAQHTEPVAEVEETTADDPWATPAAFSWTPEPTQDTEPVAEVEETQADDPWTTPAAFSWTPEPAQDTEPVAEVEETKADDPWATPAAFSWPEPAPDTEPLAEADDPWATPAAFSWPEPAPDTEPPAEADDRWATPAAFSWTPEPSQDAEPVAEVEETKTDDPWATPAAFSWTPEPTQDAEPLAEADDPWATPAAFSWTPEPSQDAEPVAEVEETKTDSWATPTAFSWTPEPSQNAEPVDEVETPKVDDPWATPAAFTWPESAPDTEPVAEVETPKADDPWATPAAFTWPEPAPDAEPVAEVEEPKADDPWATPAAFSWTPEPAQDTESVAEVKEPKADDPWATPVAFTWTPEPAQDAEPVAEVETPKADDPWATPVAFTWTPEPSQDAEPVTEVETPKADDPWATPVAFTWPEPAPDNEPVAEVETPKADDPWATPAAFSWPPEPAQDAEPAPAVETGSANSGGAWTSSAGFAWEQDQDPVKPRVESVAPTAADGTDLTNDGEPDLWAAIADEAARKGEDATFEESPVFGFSGEHRSMSNPAISDTGGGDTFTADESFLGAQTDDTEEDLILRAFEAHAAAADNHEAQPEPALPGEFEELLGKEAGGIMDEVSAAGSPGVSFARMQASSGSSASPGEPASDGWTVADAAPAPVASTVASPQRSVFRESFTAPSEAAAVEERQKKTRTLVRELVETGLLALLVFLAVRASFQNFKVDGNSMYPTLENGQFLIVNKLVYSEVDMARLASFVPFIDAGEDSTKHVFHAPERGDIIVLQDPSDQNTDLIKRVIGLPGDKLQIHDGAVYINDFRLDEPYITQQWHDTRAAVVIPEGHYFVMGDNRDNSKDSRSSAIGFVPEDLIIGRAEVTYWPFDAFGGAPNADPEVTTDRIPMAAAMATP